MPRNQKPPNGRCLKPLAPVLFVYPDRIDWLSSDTVDLQMVGQKAFGLCAIPAAWTLPFFSISAQLFKDFAARGHSAIESWLSSIQQAMDAVGFAPDETLLVRSSGCGEDMNLRGALHTVEGNAATIRISIIDCLEKLSREPNVHIEPIPLLVQKACVPVRSRGHLSNERRCYEEARDWMGEIESVDPDSSAAFQINIRHWRERITPNTTGPLACSLTSWISEALKAPAEWAYSQGARVHFEWVWDGEKLYLVQADEETIVEGLDPVEQYRQRHYKPVSFTPRALRLVSLSDAQKFAKIRNVFVYYQLLLPTAPLFILDSPKAIEQISKGNVSEDVASDLAALVKGSLVIRTDLATEDLSRRQLLPRTQEVRSQEDATQWLIKQCCLLCEMNEPGAFLFHNFIPAVASAFAYAAPGEPVVQIEGLWGLPEGLYYNTHDKFVVDTKSPDVRSWNDSAKKYAVRTKTNFKRNYVAPNDEGKWETCSLRAPFDWRASLADSECRYIAHHSRRIAEVEGHPVSIMWFIGVPKEMAPEPMIPWYHERFDPKVGRSNLTTRTKTTFDRCFVIRKASDVVALSQPSPDGTPLRRIRVQPQEEALLRDKNTLRDIGQAARANDAVIVLEGAVLSHAYYQLLQTGAVVEVVHPFVGFEDRIVFNKLVRDRIPEIIKKRGERIMTVTLNPDSHIKALREKLVEEAYELLDATDLNSVIAEMADVETVLQSLCKLYRISRKQLDHEIAAKRKERGGFEKGIVLLETESVLPTAKAAAVGQLQLAGVEDESLPVGVVDSDDLQKRTALIDRRIDRHVSNGQIKITAAGNMLVTRRAWEIATKEERTSGRPRHIISGEVRGEREGAEWKVEVQVNIQEAPPELL